ncbi:MAG: hypothetical protein AAFN18_17575 [Cyanobacteria bacterium J06554_6]
MAIAIENQELVTILAELKQNEALNSEIALAALSKVAKKTVIDLCEILPTEIIDKPVDLTAIRCYRKTHYIGTLMPWTRISKKDILLKKLENAPPKTWWRRQCRLAHFAELAFIQRVMPIGSSQLFHFSNRNGDFPI